MSKDEPDWVVEYEQFEVFPEHKRKEHECSCNCHFGGLDEEGKPYGKQPCDECDCPD
jgi:hypothetical protein